MEISELIDRLGTAQSRLTHAFCITSFDDSRPFSAGADIIDSLLVDLEDEIVGKNPIKQDVLRPNHRLYRVLRVCYIPCTIEEKNVGETAVVSGRTQL